MTHDANEKLCQFVEMTERDYEVNQGFYAPPDCQCVLIAKVRNDALSAAREAVAAVEGGYSVPLEMPVGAFIDAMRREYLSAIDALREKP